LSPEFRWCGPAGARGGRRPERSAEPARLRRVSGALISVQANSAMGASSLTTVRARLGPRTIVHR
jgi:hypothetical protein